jgi:hypothetical protein
MENDAAVVMLGVGELADAVQVTVLGYFDVDFCEPFEGLTRHLCRKARNGPEKGWEQDPECPNGQNAKTHGTGLWGLLKAMRYLGTVFNPVSP